MRQGVYIGAVVSLQLIAQLITQLLVIRIVGIGQGTDAYIAAQTVPAVLAAIIITALQSVWLPRLSVLTGDAETWKTEQSIAQGQAALLGGGLLFLVGISASIWVPVIFPGFDLYQQELTVKFCWIFLVAAAFNSQSALLTVALRARGRFLAAEIVALLGTLIALVVLYYILPKWGLDAAVWVVLFRSVLVYIVQMKLANWPPLSITRGFGCKSTWRLMKPLLFGTSIYKTAPLVDRYWASQASAGGLTILGLAYIAMSSVATIIEKSVCMPITPNLARHVNDNEYQGLRKAYRKGVFQVTMIVLLLGVFLFFMKPVFLWAATAALDIDIRSSSTLWMMCILLLAYVHVAASGTLAVAAFYAMGNTKTPVRVGLVAFILSIGIKSLGFISYGLMGLVAAISIYYAISMLIMCFLLERAINEKLS